MPCEDRRTFLRAALGASLLPLAACTEGDHDDVVIRPRWVLDSSVLPSEVTLNQALDLAVDLGCEAIDLRRSADAQALLAVGVDRAREVLGNRGLALGLVTVNEPGFDRCVPVLEAVAEVGAEGLVATVRGTQGITGVALKEAVSTASERLRSVVAEAVRLRVRLVVENQGGSLIHTSEGLHVFAQSCPKFGLAISLGRLDPRDEPYAHTVENLGPRVVRLALAGSSQAPADGTADPAENPRYWDEVIRALDRCGYAGGLSIGVPGRVVDPRWIAAAQDAITARFRALS